MVARTSLSFFSLFIVVTFLRLDQNDTLYNSYFEWKGTGEMINTKFFCRLCALLHDPRVNTVLNVSQYMRLVPGEGGGGAEL